MGRQSLTIRQRGMTLLEILVVIVILVALLAISFPTLRAANEKNKLRASAREIISLIKYARAEAIFGQRMTEVFLDTDKHEFWLDLRIPDEKTGVYKPGGKRMQLEQKRRLNGGVRFDEVVTNDANVIRDKVIAIDLYPDGTASPTLVTLLNERADKRMTIEVMKSTAQTEVTPGTVAEKRAAAEAAEGQGG
ncbi:MAG: prepilin-type N-terminal cleavage/methylation domain-containing protein [Candidatus Sumerlaeaceae bacterium]|nr:prepilin-type N-terminal cleavage/methylation domain-containing protein [Candidatus Sumerlaeaceae bacterium]